MPQISVTANASETLLLALGTDDTGFSVRIPTGESLGSGTLTLSTRDALNTSASAKTLDTLVVGDSFEYRTGGNTLVYYTLTGATNPNFTLIAQAVR